MRRSREIRLEARFLIKQNLSRILLASVGYIIITYILSLLYSGLSGYSEYFMKYYDMLESGEFYVPDFPVIKPTAAVLAVLIYFLSVVLQGGYQGYFLMRCRGVDAKFRDILPPARFMLRILAIYILTVLLVALGYVLFIVPGIILLYRCRLAVYVMYDNPEMSAVQCLRESGRLMKGNKMRLFRLDLSFIWWIIAESFVELFFAPVLNVWVQPYVAMSEAVFYNDIVGHGPYGSEYAA